MHKTADISEYIVFEAASKPEHFEKTRESQSKKRINLVTKITNCFYQERSKIKILTPWRLIRGKGLISQKYISGEGLFENYGQAFILEKRRKACLARA